MAALPFTKGGGAMRVTVEYYILLFFISSMLGWLMEVLCKLVQFGRFINRGFLIGPYCPIYGFGAVLVTALLSRFSAYPAAVFVLAMAVCGTLEYLTSYFMEKLFHARWWDYSHKPFNINGRVCAGTLIPFGLLGLGMIYGAKPFLFGLFSGLSARAVDALCVGLCLLLAADTVVSATVLSKIRKTADLSGEDDTEAITKSVREALARQGALMRRALAAFPSARLYSGRLLNELKAKRAQLRADLKRRELAFRREAEAREQAVRKELSDLRRQRRSRKKG